MKCIKNIWYDLEIESMAAILFFRQFHTSQYSCRGAASVSHDKRKISHVERKNSKKLVFVPDNRRRTCMQFFFYFYFVATTLDELGKFGIYSA